MTRPLSAAQPSPAATSHDLRTIHLQDGSVLVGSDLHAWAGVWTTAMSSFLWACKTLKPAVVVLNGDILDGATLSRFPRIGWEQRPSLVEEVNAAQAFLTAVHKASPRAEHILTRGNHDMRVEAALANRLPEFEGMPGTRLEELFPDWTVCWELRLPRTTIKHRWHNGANAPRQNALKSGRHYVTGHLHALGACPVTVGNETLFGVDTGTLAAVDGPQFGYCERNPRDWRSGWALLTYAAGELLWPELAAVVSEPNGTWAWRGRIHQVERTVPLQRRVPERYRNGVWRSSHWAHPANWLRSTACLSDAANRRVTGHKR
jgi:hypothetical protein